MTLHNDTQAMPGIPPVFAGAQIQGPAGMPDMPVFQGANAPASAQSAGNGVEMHAPLPSPVPMNVPGQAARQPHVLPTPEVPGNDMEVTGPVVSLTSPADGALGSIEPAAERTAPGVVTSNDEAWSLANTLKNSRFIPPALRGRVEDIFFIIVRAGISNIPWAAAFDSLHAIPSRNGDLTMSMSVKAKMGVCARHGNFQVKLTWDTNGKPLGYAWGARHGSSMKYEATYTFDDASLARRMVINKDGQFAGTNNVWEQYWPEMLKKRAMGRLLDIMFPDILLGMPSEEELDIIMEAQDSPVAGEVDNKPANRLQEVIQKSRRRSRADSKVIEPAPKAVPSEDAEAPAGEADTSGLLIDDSMLESQAAN